MSIKCQTIAGSTELGCVSGTSHVAVGCSCVGIAGRDRITTVAFLGIFKAKIGVTGAE